jgi:hypothetical protein
LLSCFWLFLCVMTSKRPHKYFQNKTWISQKSCKKSR